MLRMTLFLCVALGVGIPATARKTDPVVIVSDRGVQSRIGGPGSPGHVIGLERLSHDIIMDTGARAYGLCYCVARDKDRPGIAIPAEGYIGMPRPSRQNWYAGGFFDVRINGRSLGSTPAHAMVGRGNGQRAHVDIVFDAPEAVVRIRFLALAGGDALYTQLRLEPKTDITALSVALRCYPSAFVSHAKRRVLTPVRELAHGDRTTLDTSAEWWAVYYDTEYDAGYSGPSRTGVGPCAALWTPGQIESADINVSSYANDTMLTLRPDVLDARFVFFDFAGTANRAAIERVRTRCGQLLGRVTDLSFTDPGVSSWPLAEKRQNVAHMLAGLSDEKAAATYENWAEELERHLAILRAGKEGVILAEAAAAELIDAWENSIPELKLKALLEDI